MNIVEKQAIDFYEYDFLRGVNTLENIKSKLDSKLYNFNRDRDKLDFLKTLKNTSLEDIKDHISKGCTGCGYDEERNLAIFAIDQEIDSINQYYYFDPKSDEKFSSSEESILHSKLNDIIEKLEKQGFGQQIIFEEIEELKNHFNLGKKTWFQLLKGKLIDLTIESALEKTVVQEIYNNLSEGYEHFTKMIG
ncbi:MAG: hypothetical protein ACOVQR_06720 [Flavobacterium sp.]|jgi:hypothetical protein|uniref:hypothetical protein n=1 Tax=Flavobacterium sp. TaxID=239 RepID=UPI003BA55DA2